MPPDRDCALAWFRRDLRDYDRAVTLELYGRVRKR
jgi:hypothetical protein